MQAMINLVATRQKAGKPAELLRWYNDHVHLLMGFDELQGATLYRCTAPAKTAPEYVCLYNFASASAFAAFEASDAKERARQVTETGWGKQGIEIIQRTQYITGGKWTGQTSSSDWSFHIQCLDMNVQAHDASNLKRWLADSLYVAATRAGVNHYEWYASSDQQQVIVLASASAAVDPAWDTWWRAESKLPLGQAPSAVRVKWQAGYERLSVWRR
jgi:heme-degrading monooxygenase HmoA